MAVSIPAHELTLRSSSTHRWTLLGVALCIPRPNENHHWQPSHFYCFVFISEEKVALGCRAGIAQKKNLRFMDELLAPHLAKRSEPANFPFSHTLVWSRWRPLCAIDSVPFWSATIFSRSLAVCVYSFWLSGDKWVYGRKEERNSWQSAKGMLCYYDLSGRNIPQRDGCLLVADPVHE